MAKLKKNATLEEKLGYYNEAIAKAEEELKALKTAKKDIEKEIKDKELSDLQALMKEKGVTVDELKKLITSENSEEAKEA